MNAGKQPDSLDGEFELDLTGENERQSTEQRGTERQQSSSSLAGTVEFRDKKIAVRIDDLSVTGVGVSMDSRLPLNEECKLTIQLSVCGSDYELTMKSRVRHCDKVNNKTYEAGLQFIDMAQSTRDTLLLLVR
jgi:c-di-GMP-binding flagellar brake protein YcgR